MSEKNKPKGTTMKRLTFVVISILILWITSLFAKTNVILFIGDGMGQNAVSITRYMTVGPQSSLTMETLDNNCWVKTYAKNSLITDSGASGSAMATGKKHIIKRISTADDGITPNKSITEYAKEEGYAVGIITTMCVTHATPAAFTAHGQTRYEEESFALQQLDLKPNILFGGGREYYTPKKDGGKRGDNRNLIAEFKDKGYEYASTRDELISANGKNGYVLGLFADGHMDYDIVRDELVQPSIAEMTEKAIEILSGASDKGFFLMVEGGNIDYAGHGNEFENLLGDVLALDKAIAKAKNFASKEPNTLIMVTADHETGGLAIIGYDDGNSVNVYAPADKVVFPGYELERGYGFIPTTEYEIVTNWASNPAILKRTSQKTPLGDHTSSDVWLGASGPNSELFKGFIENTYIFDVMAKTLGVKTE